MIELGGDLHRRRCVLLASYVESFDLYTNDSCQLPLGHGHGKAESPYMRDVSLDHCRCDSSSNADS